MLQNFSLFVHVNVSTFFLYDFCMSNPYGVNNSFVISIITRKLNRKEKVKLRENATEVKLQIPLLIRAADFRVAPEKGKGRRKRKKDRKDIVSWHKEKFSNFVTERISFS